MEQWILDGCNLLVARSTQPEKRKQLPTASPTAGAAARALLPAGAQMPLSSGLLDEARCRLGPKLAVAVLGETSVRCCQFSAAL
jgi:hypothetical protein